MNHDYDDIRSKIAEPPQWWDENAVPRYCTFTPDSTANIYADEVVMAEITCQSCGRPFRVAFAQDSMARYARPDKARLADDIRTKALHYGDPPNVWCCSAGPTMNSEPRRVLEYWSIHHEEYVDDSKITDMRYFDWRRDPTLEVSITPDWVDGAIPSAAPRPERAEPPHEAARDAEPAPPPCPPARPR
jgi:hypothetical protein